MPAATIDEYLARQSPRARRVLQRVRTILRKAVPGAEEVISYQIPALRLGGRLVIFFAGWKSHYSLYPATDGLAEAFAKELAPYEVSKGTLRFPLDAPIPTHLIAKLAKYRAEQTMARNEAASARKAAKKPAKAAAAKATPTAKKAATKKPAAKKVATKNPAKKAAAKKPTAKKPAAKKPAVKKPAVKKPAA